MAVRKKGLGKGLDSMFPSYNKGPNTGVKNEQGSKTSDETSDKSKTSKISKKSVDKSKSKDSKTNTGNSRKAKPKKNDDVSRETSPTSETLVNVETDKKDSLGKEERSTQSVVTAEEVPAKANGVSADPATELNVSEKELNASEKDSQEPVMTNGENASENLGGVVQLKITEVEPNKEQPRKTFGEDALQELSESIKQYGIIQPLIVQKRENYYEIIAGERRWRAAKMAGLKEVPVIIRDFSKQEIMEVALIENIQRENLNPIEEAEAYRLLLDEFSMKQDELAEKVSKSRTAITNALRLLKLDERVRQMLVDELISAGHARALLGVEDPNQQYELAQRIFDEKISVREVEKIVKKLHEQKKTEPEEKVVKDDHTDVLYKEIEERIKNILGTKVALSKKTSKKGKIEIEYYSEEDLERIFDLILSIPAHS